MPVRERVKGREGDAAYLLELNGNFSFFFSFQVFFLFSVLLLTCVCTCMPRSAPLGSAHLNAGRHPWRPHLEKQNLRKHEQKGEGKPAGEELKDGEE